MNLVFLLALSDPARLHSADDRPCVTAMARDDAEHLVTLPHITRL